MRDITPAALSPLPTATDKIAVLKRCSLVENNCAHHEHEVGSNFRKCIQDIHHRMLHKDARLAVQVDVTATPRHNNGAIFVQTISDYPLVEAIHQNVVRQPVLPDAVSRARLEKQCPELEGAGLVSAFLEYQ